MLSATQAPTTLAGGMKEAVFLPGFLFAGVCLMLLLLLAWPRLASWRRGRGRHVLGPAEVEGLLLGAGALVVDLRDAKTFPTGHIRGCLHVPFAELPTRLMAPDPKADRALILVDETDALSHQAYDLLVSRGFSWLYVMKGGMKAWRRGRRPMAR